MAILLSATIAGAWLLSPAWWNSLGGDSRVFYAAARVAASGGNPYDFERLRAEENRVNDATPPGQRQAFSPAPYAYPPIMTALYTFILPLGERGFYWANVAVLLGALGLAYGLCVSGARWVSVRLGAWALLVSGAAVLGLVAGNPSNLVFVAWAAGFYWLARGRPVVAGMLLALTLVKPPIGVALVGALALASPGMAPGLLLGSGAGAALFLATNLLAMGPVAMSSWLESLLGFATNINVSGAADQQCCLAGLPALLMSHAPTAVATLAIVVIVAALVGIGLREPAARDAFARGWLQRVAVLTAAALAISPYLHLNDLVLETVPLMVVAGQRLRVATIATLVVWGLGAIAPLALNLALATLAQHPPISSIGFGVVITALTLVALVTTPEPAVAAKGTPRPWGLVPLP